MVFVCNMLFEIIEAYITKFITHNCITKMQKCFQSTHYLSVPKMLHRESNMSAHVLMNLSNELGARLAEHCFNFSQPVK